MKKLNYTRAILMTFLCVFVMATGSLKAQFNARQALLVAATDTGNVAEKAIVKRLEKMGFNVIVKGQAVVTDNDASGSNLILVSATVTSSTIVTNMPSLPTLTKPVINWEPFIYDFLGFQAADGGEYTADSIKILKSNHPLAAGLPLGIVKISKAQKGISYGIPEGKATIIASNPSDTTQAVIFGYEKNALMASTTAPARRVGMFFLNDVADTSMTEAGWKLFDASVYWAMSYTPASVKNSITDGTNICENFPNPFKGSTNISFTVPAQNRVRLSIYNVLGEKVNTLIDEDKLAGTYKVSYTPSNIPGGIYIYKLEVGSSSVSNIMNYLK
jgi:hypothetical protein